MKQGYRSQGYRNIFKRGYGDKEFKDTIYSNTLRHLHHHLSSNKNSLNKQKNSQKNNVFELILEFCKYILEKIMKTKSVLIYSVNLRIPRRNPSVSWVEYLNWFIHVVTTIY